MQRHRNTLRNELEGDTSDRECDGEMHGKSNKDGEEKGHRRYEDGMFLFGRKYLLTQ